MKSLPLLEYAVGSRSEAARIFQTVNDRGKDLTALEITKSYLMHRVSLIEDGTKADDLIGKIQREFSSIYDSIENIDGPREDQVQRYHFIMWNPDWTSGRDKRYYQDHLDHVKDHFRSVPEADDVMEYVYELETMFDRLDTLVNYEDCVDKGRIAERLDNLFMAGRLGNFYPLLMVAYDQFKVGEITEDQLCTLLERIETFIVRTYIIEQKSADTGRSRVYPLARRLYYSTEEEVPESIDPLDIDGVITKLVKYTDRYCDDDQLQSTLGEADVYRYFGGSNRLHELRLLLYVYEASLEREEENIQFDAEKVVSNEDNRFSIEHVWPQTPGDDFDAETKVIVKEHTHRLGNLALMTPEDNAAKGNDPFEDKKSAFDGSKVRMLERIFKNDDWGAEHIDVREQEMLQVILERWPNKYQ